MPEKLASAMRSSRKSKTLRQYACVVLVGIAAATQPVVAVPPVRPSNAAARPHIALSVGLERKLGTRGFLVTMSNRTGHRIAINRYPWIYEIQVYDSHGNQTHGNATFLKYASLRLCMPYHWVVLEAGDSATFSLSPPSLKNGAFDLPIPPSGKAILKPCLEGGSAVGPVPKYVVDSRASVQRFTGTIETEW